MPEIAAIQYNIFMSHEFYTTQLTRIYGAEKAGGVVERLLALIEKHRGGIPVPPETGLTERDAILITYGDQIKEDGKAPLKSLEEFAGQHLKGLISGMHILPFFPWSSDDGFSITDHRAVDPALGGWPDIVRIGLEFRLMVDGVINHVSARGAWFQAFLRGESPWQDYFLVVEGTPDLTGVVRPRALPLLTEYQTVSGPRRVWTTFSEDQVDLDYHNPDVLLEMLDTLLLYVRRGAQFIRLDAVAYLWKEIGTSCIHLPQTHAIIQLLRAVFDDLAPHVRLVTETNVPHAENVSYFGDGHNEAQLVYNFALPPLVLHTLLHEDATVLSHWAAGLDTPSNETHFFNFLASHDGIGLNPVRGILSEAEIESLIAMTQAHGGLISYKQTGDGGQIPYELNINYFDALCDPAAGEPTGLQVARFMASQAILLALRGVPGIYVHSLLGSHGWRAGVDRTGTKRAINRQKFQRDDLERELADPASARAEVFTAYRSLLSRRRESTAFHPQGRQKVLDLGPGVFALRRTSPDGVKQMLCLQNVTAKAQAAGEHNLAAYQTLWLEES
jgi:glycosidase